MDKFKNITLLVLLSAVVILSLMLIRERGLTDVEPKIERDTITVQRVVPATAPDSTRTENDSVGIVSVDKDAIVHVQVDTASTETGDTSSAPAIVPTITLKREQRRFVGTAGNVSYHGFVSGVDPRLDSIGFIFPEKHINQMTTVTKFRDFSGYRIGVLGDLSYCRALDAKLGAYAAYQKNRFSIKLDVAAQIMKVKKDIEASLYLGIRAEFDIIRIRSPDRR